MNSCILIGNLGTDPESFYTPEGTHIVNFPLAFRSTKKDKTNWIKVVCFNQLAEIAIKYLHTGARIAVNARLDQNKWVTEDNETKSTYRLLANQIDFLKTDGRGFEQKEHEKQEETASMDEAPF